MKVLLTKKFQASDIAYLQAGLAQGVSLLEPESFDEAGVLAAMPQADVLLGGMLSKAILQAAANVRLFQIPWTGVDTLDFGLLGQYDITLCNSHSNGSVVAEHAIALYLAAAKKINYHDRQMRAGQWNRVSASGNEVSPFSRPLFGQRIVLVGYGAVNQAVHRLMSGFEPQVRIVTRSGKVGDSISDSAEVYGVDALHQALTGADVVFVAVPLTPASSGMINAAGFAVMGAEAILVNVARGSVVDEQALFDALQQNLIYAAGIDTWYRYPKPGEQRTLPSDTVPFHELNNLVMSPHRAGYVDAGFPHLDDAICNINRLVQGEPLINRISTRDGY